MACTGSQLSFQKEQLCFRTSGGGGEERRAGSASAQGKTRGSLSSQQAADQVSFGKRRWAEESDLHSKGNGHSAW